MNVFADPGTAATAKSLGLSAEPALNGMVRVTRQTGASCFVSRSISPTDLLAVHEMGNVCYEHGRLFGRQQVKDDLLELIGAQKKS